MTATREPASSPLPVNTPSADFSLIALPPPTVKIRAGARLDPSEGAFSLSGADDEEMMRRGFVFLLAGLLTAGWGTSIVRAIRVAGSGASLSTQASTATLSTLGGCGTLPRSRLDYQWPVKPFAAQHPIRGNFGDPRTISRAKFGKSGPGVPGDYSFHNGVDIAAAPGTPVYAVVSGIAYELDGDAVFVEAGSRDFQYRHITPTVQVGERVVAGVTMLGRVRSPANHVHLTEIDGPDAINPVRHLLPYADWTAPAVREIDFRNTAGRPLRSAVLSGEVSIVAWAEDQPPLPVPGAWDGFPVTPAVVRWRLVGQGHLRQQAVIDLRRTKPANPDFWSRYAAGTYQNFPVFAAHFYWRYRGLYLYKLTRHPIDTRRLPNGVYTVQVVATDICGNQGTLSKQVLIDNQRPPTPIPYNDASSHPTRSDVR